MPPITALLHTANDALRLGRTLETLLPCSEILLIDHHSSDATRRIARQYGARIVAADDAARRYLDQPRHDWILCIQPGESLSESLQTSLFEWTTLSAGNVDGSVFSLFIREQVGEEKTGEDWIRSPGPETRLIPRSWTRWHGLLPSNEPSAIPLEGELLRFDLP
jgi:hypothetical protein